jgi:hypothetical protein
VTVKNVGFSNLKQAIAEGLTSEKPTGA